jgi:hypothetical protein
LKGRRGKFAYAHFEVHHPALLKKKCLLRGYFTETWNSLIREYVIDHTEETEKHDEDI